MSRTLRPLLVGVLAAVAVLSGCTASAPDVATSAPQVTASRVSTEPSPSTGQTTASTSDGGTDVDVEQFVTVVADGLADVTSYEGTISTVGATAGTGGSSTGTVRGTVDNGKAENSEADLGIVVGTQSIEARVLMIGTRTYLGGYPLLQIVPGAQGKTWIDADPRSSSPLIQRLVASMSAAGGNYSSIGSVTTFARAAENVRKGGTSTVNGQDVTAYFVDLDPAELGPASAAATSSTATIHLDGDNRVRRATVDVTAGGVTAVVTLDITAYNTPVDISAPAPSDVFAR